MNEPKHKKALETGSGILWSEWVVFLEQHKHLDHAEIVKVVLAEIERVGVSKSPEWWAQGITGAFEQHIGRRKPGQRSSGDYSVTVRKTVDGSMDEVLSRVVGVMEDVKEFDGVAMQGAAQVSETEKCRHWRCDLEDGSRLSFNIQTKPSGDKSSVAINHDGIAHVDDVERWRAFWKSFSF